MPTNPRLRDNNFDFIRLILAMIVCLVHAAELSQQSLLKPIGLVLSSKLAGGCVLRHQRFSYLHEL